MISSALDYALRSLVYMASRPDREYFGVREISENIDVSRTYLGKILQQLAKAGYLTSTTGPGGGFALAHKPNKVTIFEIMQAIDAHANIEARCILGLAECSDENPCPVHNTWKKCRREMMSTFRKTTLADALKTSWPFYQKK